MKGKLAIIGIVFTILIATPLTLTVVLPNLSPPSNPTTPPRVNIYVNSTLSTSLSSEIAQYQQDLIDQGFNVSTYNWAINNATQLKQHLISEYQQPLSLFGAVLIGTMPYIEYKNGSEIFPCDLFLMDLDGIWTDLDPTDSWFDNHFGGTGDIYPEIFIGRINPESLNNLNHLNSYRSYFARNHAYRIGNLSRPHSQLVYIDDDWATTTQLVNEWLGDMTAYSNITCVSTATTTTASDYKIRLAQSYEFVHIFVHSFYYQHQFGSGGTGSEGIFTCNDILTTNMNSLFYNLYACSACRYKEINNLGTQYLFANNTLAVVGSTKTGGMTMNSYFYTPLSQGKVFGEAFRLWFSNPLHGAWDTISQGMTILGDPFLTI